MLQTTLDRVQTSLLELLREDYKDVNIFHFPHIGICVAIKQTGVDTAKFAVSIASVSETLYRYDVAEYVVLRRWEDMETLPCNISGNWSESTINRLGYKAKSIARAIC
jgi:hypothetical protein